jgi:AcrR family transcriptional regulator
MEGKRRRRTPEAARAEILDAALALLRERPAHELTIGAVMAGTTLSRKAFYVHFRDRADLFARLIEPLRAQRDAIVERLFDAEDPLAAGRDAVLALAQLYADHGAVLKALAEAQDPDVRRAWRGFVEPVVAAHADWIRRETAAGRVTGLDPEPTARALIGMNLQFFFDRLVDEPRADLQETAETVLQIWARTLYGQDAPR